MAITNHAQFCVEMHRRYLQAPRTYDQATNSADYANSFYGHEPEYYESHLIEQVLKLGVVLVIGMVIGRLI